MPWFQTDSKYVEKHTGGTLSLSTLEHAASLVTHSCLSSVGGGEHLSCRQKSSYITPSYLSATSHSLLLQGISTAWLVAGSSPFPSVRPFSLLLTPSMLGSSRLLYKILPKAWNKASPVSLPKLR